MLSLINLKLTFLKTESRELSEWLVGHYFTSLESLHDVYAALRKGARLEHYKIDLVLAGIRELEDALEADARERDEEYRP